MFNRKRDKISIGNSSVVCGVFFRMCACVTCYLQKLLSERVCLLEVFSTISCSFTNTESLLQKRSLRHSTMYSNDAGHFDHWSLIEVIVKFIRYLNNSWAKLNEAPKNLTYVLFLRDCFTIYVGLDVSALWYTWRGTNERTTTPITMEDFLIIRLSIWIQAVFFSSSSCEPTVFFDNLEAHFIIIKCCVCSFVGSLDRSLTILPVDEMLC